MNFILSNNKMDKNVLRVNLRNMKSDNIPIYCGYCKNPITNMYNKTCYKYKLKLKSIPIDVFEEMVTKGWTRCGDEIYYTNYEKTCCKLYQPRININNFQISNEQKKIMKRFRKYLSGQYEENKIKNKINNEVKNNKTLVNDKYKDTIFQKVQKYISSKAFESILKKYTKNENEMLIFINKINEAKVKIVINKKLNFNYTCDLIFIVKKIYISLNNKKDNNKEKNKDNNKEKNKDNKKENMININENDEKVLKSLTDELYNNFINEYKPENEVISFNEESGHINFLIKDQEGYKKFMKEYLLNNDKTKNIDNNKTNSSIKDNLIQHQNKISNKNEQINDPKEDKNKNKKDNKLEKNENKQKYVFDYFPEIVPEPEIFLPLKHTYSLELTDKIILAEKEERFLLYKKYQEAVHKEKNLPVSDHNNYWGNSILEKGKKIPVPSNLKEKTKHPELYPEFYGTYNLVHRIDNKVVAVSVIDILPHMLISDYCYYDPDYSFLDLGVFTVIREIEFMKSFNSLIDNNFIYYTLGEMSETVKKLRYKGNYRPTEIMDHYTGKFVYLTNEIKKIIGDNKCHFLPENDQNSPKKFFSWLETQEVYFNLMVNIFGEQIPIDTFFNLYFEGDENLKNNIIFSIKRFLEVIDKETYQKIEFTYE